MSDFSYKDYWKERYFVPQDMQTHWVESILPHVEGKSVLDLGCGSGRFRPIFFHYKYTGIDINPDNIGVAKKLYRGKFEVMDIVEDEIPKRDTLFCWSVLNHIPPERMKAVADKINKSAKRILIGGMKSFKGKSDYIFDVDYEKLFNVKEKVKIDKDFTLYICKGER